MYDIGGFPFFLLRVSFLSIVPIPKNYQDDFAPPNANSKAMIMISTLITLTIALKWLLPSREVSRSPNLAKISK